MTEQAHRETVSSPPRVHSSPRNDWCTGAALGILLGMLIGMTISPVVSIVVAALVALFSGLFSLSEKVGFSFSEAGSRRLTAFSIAAAVTLPAAVAVRAHELLGRSVASQRSELAAMNIINPAEQREMLTFLRFGLVPKGYVLDPNPRSHPLPATGVLYSDQVTFCSEFFNLESGAPLSDRLAVLDAGGVQGNRIAALVRKTIPADQLAVAKILPQYVCEGASPK